MLQIGTPALYRAPDTRRSLLIDTHRGMLPSTQVVVAAKSKIKYPLAWWAGDWPFSSLEQEGVFVELHTRHGAEPVTWFLARCLSAGRRCFAIAFSFCPPTLASFTQHRRHAIPASLLARTEFAKLMVTALLFRALPGRIRPSSPAPRSRRGMDWEPWASR